MLSSASLFTSLLSNQFGRLVGETQTVCVVATPGNGNSFEIVAILQMYVTMQASRQQICVVELTGVGWILETDESRVYEYRPYDEERL